MGDYFRGLLTDLQKSHPRIGDVRGMGLMIGVELVTDKKSKTPDPQSVLKLFEETRKLGLLIGKGGLYGNILRISPPMTVTKDQIDAAFKILKSAFEGIK